MLDVSGGRLLGIDRFPVGCLATDRSRIIRFANAHAGAQVGRTPGEMIGLSFEALLTPASRIFCDTYVYPILLTEGRCDEIALTVAAESGDRIPVVVSACVHDEDPDLVLWSMMRADKRDKLQEEVLASRNLLQKQARSLRDLASQDELTGLMNRREFTRMVPQLSSAASRTGVSVVVALLDVDHFKAVNDTFGHQAGDDVLRQLGVAFSEMARSHELAARYGGEEFIFALAAADAEAARPFVRRLHEAAADVTGDAAPVTVSVGIHCWSPGSGQAFEDAVKAADKALYRAKALGRNRSMIESGG